MNKTYKDYSHLKVGRLQAISREENSSKWLFQCECGNQIYLLPYQVQSGNTKSCGCLHKELMSNKFSQNYEDLSGSYWNKLKESAKTRKIEFDITKKYIWDLFIQQDKLCKLTGIPLILIKKYHIDYNQQNASLDRINSFKGYTEGNVQWVDKNINQIKWNLSESRFFDLCFKIANFDYKYPEYKWKESKRHKNFKGYKGLTSSHWYQINYSIKRHPKLYSDIVIEDVWNQYEQQGGICALSGEVLYLKQGYRTDSNKTTASLDRIDSSKGYIIDNIQWVHKEVNAMKQNLNQNYFIELCRKVYLWNH